MTDKHKSLMAKTLKADPSLYAKYCNAKTPMGFTFDQAIQAGLDAPQLGVGIAAGEAAAYETFKDFMDVVLDGWHGYKPTDSHTSDMNAANLKMTPEQAAKFDKHVVSTRIRAGRSIDTLALPPGTDRKQRRTVEKLLVKALSGMTGDLAGVYYPLGRLYTHTLIHYTLIHLYNHTLLHSYIHTLINYTIHYTKPHTKPQLHYTILYYTTLHYTTLHYTTLYYTTLHCTTLHYTTLYRWYD